MTRRRRRRRKQLLGGLKEMGDHRNWKRKHNTVPCGEHGFEEQSIFVYYT